MYLSVCVFTFEVPFTYLFASTSRTRMSKIFRDFESFGLYNKDQEVIQKGSGGYTTRIRRLYNKDQEVISRIFIGIGATLRIGQKMLCLPYAGFFLAYWPSKTGLLGVEKHFLKTFFGF